MAQRSDQKVNRNVVPIAVAIGLLEESFVGDGPPVSATFSKTVRQSDRFELSGAKPCHDLLLPMVSAMQHSLTNNPAPSNTRDGFQPTLCLGIGVIDAPLIVYDPATREQTQAPWVRVIRHEPVDRERGGRMSIAVDVIHVDHFVSFIDLHVLPFATTFANRIRHAHSMLARGLRHIDRQDWSWRDLLDPT